MTQSASLLAEGVHSLADTGNQGLLLFGGHRAGERATPEHPFGYGRERYFWSFIVALVLFRSAASSPSTRASRSSATRTSPSPSGGRRHPASAP